MLSSFDKTSVLNPIWIILGSFLAVILGWSFCKKRHFSFTNLHCMITGGSSGIGLALGIEVARRGGNVSIIARSKERLASALDLIKAEVLNKDQKILSFPADVTQNEDLKNIVKKAENEAGPVDILINCAGTSVCYPFLETPPEDFKKMLDVNYLGSVHMTLAVLPSMKRQGSGAVAFVSSIAGLMGLYGYTAYSASKFALMGLAQSLQMEVKPDNISVTIAFPPDTDTPGFAEEIKNKPIETMRISESGGLFSADQVATAILRDISNKKFMSTVGFDGFILSTLCSGMTPFSSFFELVTQATIMGVLRLVAAFLHFQFDRIIKKCASEKKRHSEDQK